MHHGRAGPLGDQENSRWAPQSVFSHGPSLQAKILLQHAPFFIKHQFIRTLLLENQMNWALHCDFSRAFFASSTPLPCNMILQHANIIGIFYRHSIAFAVMHYAVQPKCIKENQNSQRNTRNRYTSSPLSFDCRMTFAKSSGIETLLIRNLLNSFRFFRTSLRLRSAKRPHF